MKKFIFILTVVVIFLPFLGYSATISGSTSVCTGSNTALTIDTSGGTWSSSNTARATINAGTGVITGVTAGTVVISYNLPAATFTAVITILGSPAAIAGTSSICEGATAALTNSLGGGTWSSASPAIASIGSGTGIVTGVSSGTAVITFIRYNSCIATRVQTVNVRPSAIGGGTSACVGTSLALTCTPSGGTWTSSTPSVASIGSTSGIANALIGGSTTISYSMATGCRSTQVLSAVNLPGAITGTRVTCIGSTTTLGSTTSGGTWSSSNTSVATVGTGVGVVTGVGTGTAIISYVVGSGCMRTAEVTVNGSVAAIAGEPVICVGSPTTFTNASGGGTWSSSNPSKANVNASSGLVTGISAGTTIISYKVSPSCFSTMLVTVNASLAAITGTTSLCVGTTTTLSHAIGGGTWSSSNTAKATVDMSSGIVTGVSTGTATITYALGDGCRKTITVAINAAALPIGGIATVCVGNTTTLTNVTGGGTWSSSNTSVANMSPSSGVVTGLSSGTSVITYLVYTGCAVTRELTVNAAPTAITGGAVVCVADTITLSGSPTGGTWTSSTTTKATIGSSTGLVTGVSSGTSLISYTLGTGCRRTQAITVIATPAIITGTLSFCEGSSTTLSSATSGGSWSSSNTSVASVGTSGIVTGVATGTAMISYALASGCARTVIVTVTAAPLAGAITGPSAVSVGDTITLSATTSGGVWSSSNSSIATVGSTGVVTGVAAGAVTISYTVSSECGSAVATMGVTVNGTILETPIRGILTLCEGSTTALTNATPGGIWVSSNTSVAAIDSGGVVTGIDAGTAIISYVLSGASIEAIVTINETPSITLGTTQIVCVAGSTSAPLPYSGATGSPEYSLSWDEISVAAGFRGTPHIITTVAGDYLSGGTYSGDGGPATAAALNYPSSVATDVYGNLYICDASNSVVRKVSPSGIISTIAGTGSSGYSGDGGPATSAEISPGCLAIDAMGNVYIGGGYVVRKVTPSGIISTVSGDFSLGTTYTGDGGPATAAGMGAILGIAIDASDNLYIADAFHHVIRKVSSSGIITTIAGDYSLGGTYSGDGGPATAAGLNSPYDVRIDQYNNLYVADFGNHVVRKVTPAGSISTVAGNVMGGAIGDGGPATDAMLFPSSVSVDIYDNLYIADIGHLVIRRVTPDGIINTWAGSTSLAGTYIGDNGPATAAGLNQPRSIATDACGNLYVADQYNNVVRKVSNITTLPSSPVSIPIPATADTGNYHGEFVVYSGQCSNSYPITVTIIGAIKGSGYLCTGATTTLTNITADGTWSSGSPEIATIDGGGVVTALSAGTANITYAVFIAGTTRYVTKQITVNQTPAITLGDMPIVCTGDTTALLPYSSVVEGVGYTIIWDSVATAIGFLGTPHFITTIAGDYSLAGTYSGDGGPATAAGISAPNGIAIDAANNLYFADRDNSVVRKVTPSGTISTVAGNGSFGYSGDGGPATAASLALPLGIAVDGAGNMYIVDNVNNVIRKVTAAGIISTIAGDGSYGYSGDGGPATAASIYNPLGVMADAEGNVYFADAGNSVVRKVALSGIISTVAGNGSFGYSGDGGPATDATLNFPNGMAIDAAGNLYIADRDNHVIRMVNSYGVISTVAGDYLLGYTYSGDGGPATAAGFAAPAGVVTDVAGNLYISELGNHVVRKVTPAGIASTVAGNVSMGYTYSGDGGSATMAGLSQPVGVALDAVGNLYIADLGNYVIRKVSNITELPSSPISIPVPATVDTGIYHGNITVFSNHCSSTYPIEVRVNCASKETVRELNSGNGATIFSVYPNPSSGSLTLTSGTPGMATIYTIDGREVGQYPVTMRSTALQLPPNLANGIYMLRFVGDDGSNKIVRLVIEQ